MASTGPYLVCTTEQTQESQHLSKGSENDADGLHLPRAKNARTKTTSHGGDAVAQVDSRHSQRNHEFLRTSAATRTWEQAEEKARKLEDEARPGVCKTAPAITRVLSTERRLNLLV